MPMKYVEPETFMVYKGIYVYHVYTGDIDSRLLYLFSTDKDENNFGYQFDVREVSKRILGEAKSKLSGDEVRQAIMTALDNGMLKIPMWQQTAKLEKLVLVCGASPIVNVLIESVCNQLLASTRVLPLNERLEFLLGHLSFRELEEHIRER